MSRQNRINDRRRRISLDLMGLDALEERRLLSGNVIATLAPATGILTITGDTGNNSITISSPSGTTNDLRVAGNTSGLPVAGVVVKPPVVPTLPESTNVNGVAYTDFALSSVKSIVVTMQNGNDTVNLGTASTGFAVPGNVSMAFGAGNDAVNSMALTANALTISATGAGNDTLNLTRTTAGGATIATGGGTDGVTLNGGAIGTASITTLATGTLPDAITVENFTAVAPSKTGIGLLSIAAGNGNNTINVLNSPLAVLTVSAGNGSNSIIASAPLINNYASIIAGNGNNTISLASPAITGAATITSGNGADNIKLDGSKFASASIRAGTGANTIDASNDSATGPAGLSVTAGTGGTPAIQTVTVNGDSVPAGPLSVSLGDGPVYYQPPTEGFPIGRLLPGSSLVANADNVGGAVSVGVGLNFRTVTLGIDMAVNALVAPSLGVGVGANADNVTINAKVSGAETIATGAAETYPAPPVPVSSFALGGTAGSLGLNVGDNFKTATQGATVAGTESATFGNNEGAVGVVRPTNGLGTITLGNGAASLSVTGTDNYSPVVPWTEVIQVGNSAGSVTTAGSVGGNGSESVTVGNNAGTIALGTAVAGNETVSTAPASSATTLSITGAVGGWQNVSIARYTTLADSATVGGYQAITGTNNDTITASGTVGGYQTISAPGANDTIAASGAVGGFQTIAAPGAGGSITDTSPKVGTAAAPADVSVTAGAGATVIVNGVTASGDMYVKVGDNPVALEVVSSSGQYMEIDGGLGGNAGSDSFYLLSGLTVTDGLDMNFGDGNNTVEMVALNILNGLFISGGSGNNSFYMGSVTADYGMINGGGGASNLMYNLGGNSSTVLMTGFGA